MGKINIVIKGVKKGNKRYLPLTLPFCYCDMMLFKNKSELYIFNEGSVIDSFQDFLSDIDTLTYASYFTELVSIGIPDNEPNKMVFINLISSFYLIKNKVCDIKIINIYYQLRFLKALGHGFSLKNCVKCKRKLISTNYFSYQYNGGVCGFCEKIHGNSISYESFSFFKYLNTLEVEKLISIHLTKDTYNELQKIIFSIISQNFSKKPKSLELLSLIEE